MRLTSWHQWQSMQSLWSSWLTSDGTRSPTKQICQKVSRNFWPFRSQLMPRNGQLYSWEIQWRFTWFGLSSTAFGTLWLLPRISRRTTMSPFIAMLRQAIHGLKALWCSCFCTSWWASRQYFLQLLASSTTGSTWVSMACTSAIASGLVAITTSRASRGNTGKHLRQRQGLKHRHHQVVGRPKSDISGWAGDHLVYTFKFNRSDVIQEK